MGRHGVQVLARAAAVLRICKDAPAGLSLAGIADRANLPRSTVQRIVAALADEGLLLAGGAAGGIRLGPQIHALAEATHFDVVEIAHPHLKRLCEATGETVDLAHLRGDHMVFVDQIAGGQRLRAVSAVGERFPLHCTANGKAALAWLDDARINQLCAAGLAQFTPATLTSQASLRRELRLIRKAGLAIDAEEHSIGISAIGAAFRDLNGALYAVSIPMPTVRFAEQHEIFGPVLLDAIGVLTAELHKR